MRDFAKRNLKALGFDKEVERVEKGQCPFCGSDKVNREDFRDEQSFREFQLSGLCQACQDEAFPE
jgi:Zn-dependent M32 family carboxypeptidase